MITSGLISYLIQGSICMVSFLLLYHILLKKEQSFQLNRWYLIWTPILSALIPLLQIKGVNGDHSQIGWRSFNFLGDGEKQALSKLNIGENSESFLFTNSDILLGIYGIGVLFLSVLFLKGLFESFHIVKKAKHEYQGNPIQLVPKTPFNSIFASTHWHRETISQKGRGHFDHILARIHPIHLFDVLIIEIMVVFGWFIPMVYYFRRNLKDIHAFISDSYLARQFGGNNQFAQYLVEQSTQHSSSNDQSLDIHLVNRVNTLNADPSNDFRKLRYFSIFPLVFSLMAIFSMNPSFIPNLNNQVFRGGESVEKWASQEVFQVPNHSRDGISMDWAGKKVSMTLIDERENIQFPFHVFSKSEFRKFQTQFPILYKEDGSTIDIVKVRISITTSDHRNFYNLECSGTNMNCLHEAMEGMPPSSSIQLVFRDQDNQQYYCILTDVNETLYVPNLWYVSDPFIFDKPQTLKSYGVDRMTRRTTGYEFIWGPNLKFDLNQKDWYPVTKEELAKAMSHLPALAPIHGGLLERIDFNLIHVELNDTKETIHLISDDNEPGLYLEHPDLNRVRNGISIGDMVYVEQIRSVDGRNLGGFTCKVVEDSKSHTRRKWNIANFNFSDGKRSYFQNSLSVEPDAYVLKWGSFYIPLELYASPNYYKAKLEIEIDQFKDLLDYPVEVFRNDQKLLSEEVIRSMDLIHFENDDQSIQHIAGFTTEGEIRLQQNGMQRVKTTLRPGLHLTLSGIMAGININSMEIEIIDPEEPYIPPVSVFRHNQHSNEEFSFQVIQGIGNQKTIIKIDSTVQSSKEIMSMYRDDQKYEIVQIPGFRTKRRLLTPDLKTLQSKPKSLGEGLVETKRLSEWSLNKEDRVLMKWGRMMASPASGNYSSKEFRYSGTGPLQLYLNNNLIGIHQMDIKLYSGNKLTHHYQVSEFPHPIFQKAIQSITSRGTVHISNIVFNDSVEQVILPQDFVFSVE